jgi:hypothetical protein
VTRTLLICGLGALLACGGHKHGADGTSSGGSSGGAYVLCDGSSDVRLGFAVEGGQVDTTYQLTNPYGHSFLFIDGHCHYYASSSWLKGVVQGDLSQTRAAEIAKSLSLRRIEQLDYHDVESCPDAGSTWLRTSAGYVDCTCGCDAKAPKGIEDAIGAASELKDELAATGSALAGPILLAVVQEEGTGAGRTLPAWPLIWPLSDVAVTWEAYTRKPDASLRHLSDDEADAARMLRSQTLASDPYAASVRVTDQSKTYNLFMREELPDEAQRAIDHLTSGEP